MGPTAVSDIWASSLTLYIVGLAIWSQRELLYKILQLSVETKTSITQTGILNVG